MSFSFLLGYFSWFNLTCRLPISILFGGGWGNSSWVLISVWAWQCLEVWPWDPLVTTGWIARSYFSKAHSKFVFSKKSIVNRVLVLQGFLLDQVMYACSVGSLPMGSPMPDQHQSLPIPRNGLPKASDRTSQCPPPFGFMGPGFPADHWKCMSGWRFQTILFHMTVSSKRFPFPCMTSVPYL